MANETSYYFGAYLEIRVKKKARENVYFSCGNDHRQDEVSSGYVLDAEY
jgi:hypothetical protein